MKNSIIICVIFYFQSLNAQIIFGKIVNEQKAPLTGVNVYFDGTTIGTITDFNGNFSLNYGSKLNAVLVVSSVGFQTEFITDKNNKIELYIVLYPVAQILKEVIVSRDGFSRQEKIKLFREQFLGTTTFGKKATIENEDDLYFEYNKKSNTLTAFSEKPLIINNNALGYTIRYELLNFITYFYKLSIRSSDVKKSYYAGVSRFEETDNSSKTLKRRINSYQGSQLQFLRTLAGNLWNKDNFLLFKGSFQANPKDYFTITDTLDLKKITVAKQIKGLDKMKFVAEFSLLYKKTDQSKIIFETANFYIDQFGNNSNLENILFSGKIIEQKVGDMLPLNYGIN
jgi:hypothetical protein